MGWYFHRLIRWGLSQRLIKLATDPFPSAGSGLRLPPRISQENTAPFRQSLEESPQYPLLMTLFLGMSLEPYQNL
jgi:hypothetical protein